MESGRAARVEGTRLLSVGDEHWTETPEDRILVVLDPWSNTSTGDEDWRVVYDIPEGDCTWEVGSDE
jgi:hypothetical protein